MFRPAGCRLHRRDRSRIHCRCPRLRATGSRRLGGGSAVTKRERQGAGWKARASVHGTAKTEIIGGVPCFTVRSPGSFAQVVEIPPSAAGQYAAIVGRGYAERVNSSGSITGLPYLYVVVIAVDRTRFLGYWQGQQMLARPSSPGEWVTMSGVFRVPDGAAAISVQLNQAERKGDPQDGSAARFADVRMALFPTEDAARGYVAAYR
jgi:hypothetical protein